MTEYAFKNGTIVERRVEVDDSGKKRAVDKFLNTPEPTEKERIAALEEENILLKAQIAAQSEQMDFYEDCIVEMATIVYA